MHKRGLIYFDFGLLIPVVILILINLFTLFSLNIELFKNELTYVCFGFLVFIGFSFINHKAIKLYARPFYIASIILLTAVLFFGVETRGSLRWIELYGFRIQFAELLKPFLAISLASFLVSSKSTSLKVFIKSFLYLLPIAFLIFIQPDLGDALVYAFVLLFTLIYWGFPVVYFIWTFLGLVIISPIGWLLLHDYQKQRIMTFLNPSLDPLGRSYNAIQSVIAVGAGMFTGLGFGQGSQSGLRFLPERHTDFIFATISEQLGFIGAGLIIICFLLLFYKIYKIVINSIDSFSRALSVICLFMLFIQFVVNIGMNIGILPIVGVTLPFLSYGGSSMLTNFMILGLLNSISRSTSNNKVLEIG